MTKTTALALLAVGSLLSGTAAMAAQEAAPAAAAAAATTTTTTTTTKKVAKPHKAKTVHAKKTKTTK